MTNVDLEDLEIQALDCARFVDRCIQLKDEKERIDVSAREDDIDGGAFFDAALQLHENGKTAEILSKILDEKDHLFNGANDTNVLGCFRIVSRMIQALPEKEQGPYVSRVCKETAASTERPLLRLAVLTDMYNVLNSSSVHMFDTFFAVVDYAAAVDLTRKILPQLRRVHLWVDDWNLTQAQVRTVCLRVSKLMKDTGDMDSAYKLLIKYLETFQGADAGALAGEKAYAAEVAVMAIGNPDLFQFDSLLDLKAVGALAKDAEFGGVYELLDILIYKQLPDYLVFAEKNKALLQKHALDHDGLSRKMRLLTLASLACDHATLPYATAAAQLKVDENEVEEWVIQAIGAGLIDGRLDQLQNVVVVHRATQRSFAKTNWVALRDQLVAWRSNVGELLTVIQNARDNKQQH